MLMQGYRLVRAFRYSARFPLLNQEAVFSAHSKDPDIERTFCFQAQPSRLSFLDSLFLGAVRSGYLLKLLWLCVFFRVMFAPLVYYDARRVGDTLLSLFYLLVAVETHQLIDAANLITRVLHRTSFPFTCWHSAAYPFQ